MKTLSLLKLNKFSSKFYKTLLTILLTALTAAQPSLAAKKGKKMLLDQKTSLLNGEKINLNVFSGKIILFVNTASYCGYTSQYKDLQTLHERYEKQGFTVIAIPCNSFGKQEPGEPNEIKKFLEEEGYAITFPILSKRDAVGENQSKLFEKLINAAPISQDGKSIDVQWNFEKFLVNHNQKVVARFRSSVKPLDSEILIAIEQALKDKDKK